MVISSNRWLRPALMVALATVLVAFAWQALTVHYNYGGNWTALFCTGSAFPPPEALASENIYRFPNSTGYDGQFYHYIAHDPFLRRGFSTAIDSPQFRYRRCLIPLLAWSLAAGNDGLIHIAYFALVLCSIFLAALWTAGLASDWGAHPAWGAAVLLVPAVTISLDRMTVDASLVALIAGVVFYTQRSRWGIVGVLCVLACLVRDTGMLVPAAIVLWAAAQRRFRLAGVIALTPIPALAWYYWLAQRTLPTEISFPSIIPFFGLFYRLVHPSPYPFSPVVNLAATLLDYAALAGMALAAAYALWRFRLLWKRPEGFLALLFATLVAAISLPAVWTDAYAFARAFSPLILLTGFDALRTRSLPGVLPLALTAPRIGLQLVPQVLHVLQKLGGA